MLSSSPIASTSATSAPTSSSTESSARQRRSNMSSESAACGAVSGGCMPTTQWCSGHEAFQAGVRGALRPANAAACSGAASAGWCGACGAT